MGILNNYRFLFHMSCMMNRILNILNLAKNNFLSRWLRMYYCGEINFNRMIYICRIGDNIIGNFENIFGRYQIEDRYDRGNQKRRYCWIKSNRWCKWGSSFFRFHRLNILKKCWLFIKKQINYRFHKNNIVNCPRTSSMGNFHNTSNYNNFFIY